MSRNDNAEMIATGNQMLESGQWPEAEAQFAAVCNDSPNDVEAMMGLGLAVYRQNRLEEAETFFKRALAIDDQLIPAYFNLGAIYEAYGKLDNALMFYKEVITREDQDVETLLRMGRCAQALGREDDALSFWEEVLRLAPQHPEAGNLVAAIYINREQWADAEDALRVSLVSHPNEVSLHFVLGLVLKEQKKWESALAAFNKVVTLDDKHAQGFFHLGEVCLALDLVKQAEPFLAKAFKLDQSNLEALRQLGGVYEKRKDRKSAALMYGQWIEQVEPVLENHQINMFNRLCAYVAKYWLKQGDEEKAKQFDAKVRVEESTDDYRVSLTIDE